MALDGGFFANLWRGFEYDRRSQPQFPLLLQDSVGVIGINRARIDSGGPLHNSAKPLT
jgi:hypothetical protein